MTTAPKHRQVNADVIGTAALIGYLDEAPGRPIVERAPYLRTSSSAVGLCSHRSGRAVFLRPTLPEDLKH